MTYADVNEILTRLPGMQRGCVVERLANGPTNSTYRVAADGAQFVLRLDKPEALPLGLDRANERIVSAAVAAAGLTPAYSHFDLGSGVCLRPFIAGRSLRREDLMNAQTLERLAGVLKQLHALPPLGSPFDPAAAARRYATGVASPEADRLADRTAGLAADIRRYPAPSSICHNDLVAENVLQTERGILIIDWEYAAVGDPFFDLAVVVRHHELGDSLAARFLNAYLQRRPTEVESQRFALQCRLYESLLALWNLRVGGRFAAE